MRSLLYHCFPGFLGKSRAASSRVQRSDKADAVGLLVLGSILDNGLVLAPEEFRIPSPVHHAGTAHDDIPHRANGSDPCREGKDFGAQGEETAFRMIQVRACFTLATRAELEQQASEATYATARPSSQLRRIETHFDLFGGFALGINPLDARWLGAMPTIYYYRPPSLPDEDPQAQGSRTLSLELLSRLLEARTLLVALAHVEALAGCGDARIATTEQLRSMGQSLDRQPDHVIDAVEHITPYLARQICPLLDTQRMPIWNIVQHIEMLLSLFQVADSRSRNRPLAYFQQREWRIIQHNKIGLDCDPLLGIVPHHRGKLPTRTLHTMSKIDALLERPYFARMLAAERPSDGPWLLSACDGRPFRDFVREIIVPDGLTETVQAMLSRMAFREGAPEVVTKGCK